MTKKLASHLTWLLTSLPLILLALFFLLAWGLDRLTQVAYEGTGTVTPEDNSLFNTFVVAILVLMPVSVLIGIVMLLVILVMCLRKKLAWTERHTLISAGLACADILLPVGVVIVVLLYFKSHPMRVVF
jgi:hypothetical protein